jgi:mannose-6-phosphate isomerase-like protein (cupin superfamily)
LIETIRHAELLLAIVVRSQFRREGIEFFTAPEYSLQLGYLKRGAGLVIPPHIHNPVRREVHETKEVLIVRSGRVRVDLYTNEREYLKSLVLEAGDVILLADGGHGFEMLEDCEMIEVKQGPYTGDSDKTRFEPSGPGAPERGR